MAKTTNYNFRVIDPTVEEFNGLTEQAKRVIDALAYYHIKMGNAKHLNLSDKQLFEGLGIANDSEHKATVLGEVMANGFILEMSRGAKNQPSEYIINVDKYPKHFNKKITETKSWKTQALEIQEEVIPEVKQVASLPKLNLPIEEAYKEDVDRMLKWYFAQKEAGKEPNFDKVKIRFEEVHPDLSWSLLMAQFNFHRAAIEVEEVNKESIKQNDEYVTYEEAILALKENYQNGSPESDGVVGARRGWTTFRKPFLKSDGSLVEWYEIIDDFTKWKHAKEEPQK